MEVLHSQSARLRPLLPGHAHSAVPSPHARAVFMATPPPCQSFDVGEEDTSPPAARRGSAVVKELLNMGFCQNIAERASKEAPDIAAAVEEAIRLSSATSSRPSETHSVGKAQPSTTLLSGSRIPPAILLLDREEHGSRSPATPSTPSRVASNVSSVVWQERRRDVSAGVDASASEAELQQYRRHCSSSVGADAYAALEAEREFLTTDDMISLHRPTSDSGVTKQPVAEMTRSVQPSSVPQAHEEMRPHASMQDWHHLRGEGDLLQAQFRLDQLRKRRESLLSDCSPGPKSPSSSSFSSQTLIEGTKPVAGQATPLRDQAPILLVRPQSRTLSVDPTNLGAHANGHGGSHEHSNGQPASPAATRRSFDASIDSTPDYPYSARIKSSLATGPTGLQQTSRERQEPLVAGIAAHYVDASPGRLNGESPILSNANVVSGTCRPGHDHGQVTENQGLGRGESHRGLGMRVKEKADGSVYINYMQKGGAAAAADPFLKVGDRVLSIGMALDSKLPEFSRFAHIVKTHIQ
jgi:hypothetical protein